VAEFDYGLLAGDTPYPYAVQCESHKTVAIAEGKLRDTPTRGSATQVVEVEARGDSVRRLQHARRAPRLETDYLVGTDGARKPVRVDGRRLGLPDPSFAASPSFNFQGHLPRLRPRCATSCRRQQGAACGS
jgi:3-(3-hydroxy-phenyl)propionate hydroxylase